MRGMVRDRCPARLIAAFGFFEFRRQVESEAAIRVGVADRFYASSKTCSECGCRLDDLPCRCAIGCVRRVA